MRHGHERELTKLLTRPTSSPCTIIYIGKEHLRHLQRKRLALDLASIRQLLVSEAHHQWKRVHGDSAEPSPERPIRPPLHWVPTRDQLADVLTKRMKADVVWATAEAGQLPLRFRHEVLKGRYFVAVSMCHTNVS